mmetsp:Transcript_4683/g.9027  ORF Transcript_4683/g.9027 Transcript_4683/m.9027 type:complete len:878 (-) Transcript_4683:184-2817(-)
MSNKTLKLRDLIRAVRACKTAAEERAVISKECALCRTAFKDPTDPFRHRNMAKMLYMHMLGFPTHFAQMESLQLIASTKFAEKRLGYLALMILLDEQQKVLMLVTNSLKNDLENHNPFISGLALCSLGNIASTDMSRDLSNEVEKFFRNPNPYLRKKATLCAIRVIRKVPDLIDDYIEPALSLLSDKNHAVLLGTLSLIIEILKLQPNLIKKFRPKVPTLVKLLKNLVLAGYVSEYDVVGITDPFLQTKIIHLLRVLGTGSSDASDHMNDILAQVSINTEPTKNPGNAILYECVQTIMSIEAEGGLRVLAINILGRFLLNRDNNIRYVALNTLCRVVNKDTQAIQRHRNTVVDCLKDGDISIRRRALDLIYALVTKNNVKALIKELLNYLAVTGGDSEFKTDLTDKICVVAERFAPNRRWHIDTLIDVLKTAGNFTRENVHTDVIMLISRSKAVHSYAVHKLYEALQTSKKRETALVNVALWAIGEFGDLLVSPNGLSEANQANGQDRDEKEETPEPFSAVSEQQVLDCIRDIMKSITTTNSTKEILLTTLIKLAVRFSQERSRIKKMVGTYRGSLSLELQARSCEYYALMSSSMDGVRDEVVARMPVLAKKKKADDLGKIAGAGESKKKKPDESSDEDSSSEDESGSSESDSEDETPKKPSKKTPSKSKSPAPAPTTDLLGMADLFATTPSNNAAPTPAPAATISNTSNDLLDLFGGGGGVSSPTPAAAASPATTSNPLDFFGMPSGGASPPPVASQQYPAAVVFQNNGLSVTFNFHINPATPNVTEVSASYTNSNASDISNFEFQVALPKYIIKKSMSPASSTTIPAHNASAVSQKLILENTQHGAKKIVIRVMLKYTLNGAPVVEKAQIDQFPQ